jgi:carotenoid cleavage dioxygenase
MASAAPEQEKPFHLRGNYAPVEGELTVTDLEVEGAIPPELSGRYLRNGSNPISGESEHWFFGDGMIHGVEIQNGRPTWYKNRYVKTPLLETPDASRMGGDGLVDHKISYANTHIISHAGRILALEEGAFPYELTKDLDTVGYHDFDGKLATAMTAHPRICPDTGELLFFAAQPIPPHLTYHRADADGRLVQSEEIQVKGGTMMHDFNITRNHVIFMDLPVVFDFEALAKGGPPLHWDESYGARLGVLPRNGTNADVRWFDIDPCYVFHPVNAYERDGKIVLHVARYEYMWRESMNDIPAPNVFHWEIDLAAGKVSERQVDDRFAEFGRIAPGRVGKPNRYGYLVSTRPGVENVTIGDESTGGSVLKYDLETGDRSEHDFGEGITPGETLFVPADGGSAEDDGYLMGYAYDKTEDRSELFILDATNVAAPPIARVKLPRRVPFGFHGSWIAD